jgi:hypothetical protein
MSGPAVFGGGQIDIVSLFRALKGKPLQARLQETFKPHESTGVEARTGRLLVSSRGWARFDIKQGSVPEVTFAYDLVRNLIGGGLTQAPDTWTWSPWAPASNVARSLPEESQPRPASPDVVLVEGVACQVSEYRGGGTVTREWYAPELGLPLRVESAGPAGTRLFRIYDIRQHEPAAAEWPRQQD